MWHMRMVDSLSSRGRTPSVERAKKGCHQEAISRSGSNDRIILLVLSQEGGQQESIGIATPEAARPASASY